MAESPGRQSAGEPEEPGEPRKGGESGAAEGERPAAVAALPGPAREELEYRVQRRGRALREEDVHIVRRPVLKRAVGASALGNCMEWYDFGVYSYLAATIGEVFFPDASPVAQVLSSFATFAAAFVVRPLGGLFFGPLGDRLGRQRVLAATMLMMAFGTFMIGFIPSYETIGIAAPALLLFARMLQGFSTGGEYGGATTFVAESSPDRRRGFLGSFLDMGTFLGYALGSALVTVLGIVLTHPEMVSWGWRVPFWVAGPLGLVGLYMRLKLEDSPAYQQQLSEHEHRGGAASGQSASQRTSRGERTDQRAGHRAGGGHGGSTSRHEWRVVLTDYRRALLVCVGLVLLYNVTNYMVTAYLPTYQTETLGRGRTLSDVLVLCGMLWIVLAIAFVGRLSDRVGRKPVYRWTAVAQIVLAVPAFALLRSDGWLLPLIGVLVLASLLAGFAGPSAATLPALFPTVVRYSAMGIGFNFSVAAFGGSTPLITEALVGVTGLELLPGCYLMVAGAIGLVTVRYMPESAWVPLYGAPPMADSAAEAQEITRTSRKLLALSRRRG